MLRNFKYFLSPLAIAMVLLWVPQARAQSPTARCFLVVGNFLACLDKTVSPNPATVGQPLTLTLTESTTNPLAFIFGLTSLTDTLPPGLIFVSVTNNGGSLGTAPPCTFTPPTNPATSSGTVTCPAPRQGTGPNLVTGDPGVPFIATITAIPTRAGSFSNPAVDSFNSTSAPYTVLNAELRVNYFAGANGARPDQTLRITNPGAGIDPAINPSGDLCANIYVFRRNQQLAECCSCLVTPNGLRTLSVDFDLARNPLTPGAIGEGVIKIVSALVPTGGCTTATAASSFVPSAALRSWQVHNQDVSGGTQGTGVFNAVTETESTGAPLSAGELTNLQRNCGFVNSQGSGAGICTCGRGD